MSNDIEQVIKHLKNYKDRNFVMDEVFGDPIVYENRYKYYNLAIQILQAQFDEKRTPDGWIENEEQPPDNIGQLVWAYSVDGEIILAKYVGEGLYWADNGMTYYGTYFTHWMPANVPEPPREENL